MTQCTSSDATRHFSPSASLAALGAHLRQIDLFGPVRDRVKIAQKTVKQRTVPVNCSYWVSIESVRLCVCFSVLSTAARAAHCGNCCAPLPAEDAERKAGRMKPPARWRTLHHLEYMCILRIQ